MNAIPLWQRVLAGLLGIGAAISLAMAIGDGDREIAVIPGLFLALAAICIHLPRLGAQLFARGAWWSNFALGTFITFVGNKDERNCGLVMATLLAVTLLLVGQRGLGEAGERTGYAPSAFRTTFMLLMILVLADMQTLGFLDYIVLRKSSHSADAEAVTFTLGAVGFFVAFVGLYRVTLWGVIASLVTATGVGASLYFGHRSDKEIVTFIGLSCALQIVIGAPMLLARMAGITMPQASPRVRVWVSRGAILTLWVAGLFGRAR